MKGVVNSPTAVGFCEWTCTKRGGAVLAWTLLLGSVVCAQEERLFEPQYASVFYGLRATGEPIELERQTPDQSPKGFKVLLAIPGEKSPVRFSAGEEVQFVVWVADDFGKAAATMQLFRFEVQNGRREFLAKIEDLRKNKIGLKLNAEKYGTSSVKVTPAERLAPGEYCLSRSTISQGFCFGVDATGNH